MKKHHRFSHSAMVIAIAAASNMAFAQNNDADKIEEVVVLGTYQKSLQSAMDLKRNSGSFIEAIAAEDIGQLPDVSISDSLNRLPGLAQDRDRGNGSQISIRGMGGLLGLTTLNGREVATVEEDRNVRYDQFPSELINAAQVYKTPQARITEGGVSGTVNLETIKPLDFNERQVSVDVRGSFYDLGADIDDAKGSGWGNRFSLAYIDQFADDTLGVAIGYAQRSQPIATQRSELWNYGDTWHNSQWNDELGKQVVAPWGGSALVRGGEDSRNGFMAAIQWQPNENFELAYDGFFSQFEINETQRGFDFQISSNYDDQWIVDEAVASQYTNVDTDAVDLLAGTVALSTLRNLNEEFTQDDTLVSHGLNAKWTQDAWTVSADLSYSKTERDRRWASVRTTNNNPGWATFGATSDDRMWITLLDADLTDLSQNSISEIEVKPQSHGDDEIAAFKLDFTRELNWGLINEVQFGVSTSVREKSLAAQNWFQYVSNGVDTAIDPSFVTDQASSSYWSDLPSYLSLDRNKVINHYFGGLKNPAVNDSDDLLSSWAVDEDIFAQYVQFNLETEIGSMPLTGNIGVRAVQTETTASGFQQGANVWIEEPAGSDNWVEVIPSPDAIAIDHSYDEVLPSMNLVLSVTDDQQIRFGAAKTIARAPVDLMSPSLNLNQDLWGANPGESTSGNPKLDPFRATQIDLGYEWYFTDDSSVSATVYYKDVDTYIARAADAEQVEYNGTMYTVSRPINGEGGYIRGYEALYQQAFTSLPAPFNSMGIYANYAYTESNIHQFVPLYGEAAGLTGLSKHVASATLWYYYEGFEARASYSYRSAFQRDINAVQGEEGMNDDEGYLDLSFSYELSEQTKLYFQVQNVTDEPYKVYGLESNNPNHINKYEEFGRRFMFGVSWKL